MLELISCSITCEWTTSVAGIVNRLQAFKVCQLAPLIWSFVLIINKTKFLTLLNMSYLQTFPLLAQLWTETALLKRLLYKNKHQHEKTIIYQNLQQVGRLLRLLSESTDVWKQLQSLHAALLIASKPTLIPQQRKVPSRTCVLSLMAVLLGMCRVLEALEPASLAAAHSLVNQIEQSYFLSLSLVLVAIISRVRALSMHLLYEFVHIYNALSDLQEFAPESMENLNPASTIDLPKSLGCTKLPGAKGCVSLVTSNSLIDLIRVKVPEEEVALNRNMPRLIPESIHPSQNHLYKKGLPVIEDRGVPLSREELQLELAMEPSTSQIETAEAPAYERVLLNHGRSSQANDPIASRKFKIPKEQSGVQQGWESWLSPLTTSSTMSQGDRSGVYDRRPKRRRHNPKKK